MVQGCSAPHQPPVSLTSLRFSPIGSSISADHPKYSGAIASAGLRVYSQLGDHGGTRDGTLGSCMHRLCSSPMSFLPDPHFFSELGLVNLHHLIASAHQGSSGI